MGEDISKENKEKMNTLLDSFNDYLERTINKIMTQKLSSYKINVTLT